MADRVDELFGLPPEDFTKARDALAAELKGSGDAAAAKEVKALRKPTVAAWAVNQLSRRHPGGVRDLIEAGERLRKAQSEALGGGSGKQLRERAAERARLVDKLLQRAGDILAEADVEPAAHRERIEETLLAAAIDDDASRLLTEGRLEKPVAAEADWGWTGAEAPAPATRKPRDDAKRERARRQVEDAEAEAKESRAEASRAEREVEEAREALARAERKLQTETKRRDRAEQALQQARSALDDVG